jgi:hypothetical protein
MTRQMDRADCIMQTEMYMKATGSMIKLTEKGCIVILTVPLMRENGKRTNNTDTGLRRGPIVQSIKELTMRGKSMGRGS